MGHRRPSTQIGRSLGDTYTEAYSDDVAVVAANIDSVVIDAENIAAINTTANNISGVNKVANSLDDPNGLGGIIPNLPEILAADDNAALAQQAVADAQAQVALATDEVTKATAQADRAEDEADRAQAIADGISVGTGVDAAYNSVADMKADMDIEAGKVLFTKGYYEPHGFGSASYRIYDASDYRTLIGNSTFMPDGYGDHVLANGKFAILQYGAMLWASQLGMHPPMETPTDAINAGIDHADDINNMYTYLERIFDVYHRTNTSPNSMTFNLHFDKGTYYVNKTSYFPAGIFMVGGDMIQTAGRPVKFKPLKPHEGGNISNYRPLITQPQLDYQWVPNNHNTADRDGYMKLDPVWRNAGSGYVDIYFEFESKDSAYLDGLEYAVFGCTTTATSAWVSADKQTWTMTIEYEKPSGGTDTYTFPTQPVRLLEGKQRIEITDNGTDQTEFKWIVDDVPAGVHVVAETGVKLAIDMLGNDRTLGRSWVQGKIQYITIFSDGGQDGTGDGSNTYIEGIRYVPYGQTPNDLIMPKAIGSDCTLTNYPDVASAWRIELAYDQNTRNGFMFIWNTIPPWEATGSDVDWVGRKNKLQVYWHPQMGGCTGISMHNYETNPYDESDPDTWYNKNYLKGINGCMVYGGAFFRDNNAERIWTAFHKPRFEDLEFYTDQWEITNFKCNTPIENETYQIDLNGIGDAVNIEGCQFPVNHPAPGNYPGTGEYPNGVVKGVRIQNSASYTGNWEENTFGASAGLNISRLINGKIDLAGVQQCDISACHFEFGQVLFRASGGSVRNCYFSQISEVGRSSDMPEYFDIEMRQGEFQVGGWNVVLENCQFHRGFDYSHVPLTKYNVVVSPVHNVTIRDCYQGWDLAGSGPTQTAFSLGISDRESDDVTNTVTWTYSDVAGWDRWKHWLSSDCRIIRGKIEPKVIEREVGGFGGLEDAFLLKTSTPEYWWDDDTDSNAPTGLYLYYNCQLLLDPTDATGFLDGSPAPLGITPFIGWDTPPSSGVPGIPTSTEQSLYIPTSDGTSWRRPSFGIYSQSRTISDGVIRLYRGTASNNYTHYVDIPCTGIITLEDTYNMVYGNKWKVNPDAPNMRPLTPASNLENYQFHIRGGSGYIASDGMPIQITGWYEKIVRDTGDIPLNLREDTSGTVGYVSKETAGGYSSTYVFDNTLPTGHKFITFEEDAALINGSEAYVVNDRDAGLAESNVYVDLGSTTNRHLLEVGDRIGIRAANGVWEVTSTVKSGVSDTPLYIREVANSTGGYQPADDTDGFTSTYYWGTGTTDADIYINFQGTSTMVDGTEVYLHNNRTDVTNNTVFVSGGPFTDEPLPVGEFIHMRIAGDDWVLINRTIEAPPGTPFYPKTNTDPTLTYYAGTEVSGYDYLMIYTDSDAGTKYQFIQEVSTIADGTIFTLFNARGVTQNVEVTIGAAGTVTIPQNRAASFRMANGKWMQLTNL